MNVNNQEVIDRNNRPNVLQKVGLRVYFYNDGELQDPYEISSVSVFNDYADFSPSSILSANNIAASSTSAILMHFEASGSTLTTASGFDSSNYTPGVTASGIYRLGIGEYVVVLDGTLSLSGDLNGSTIANQVSAVGDYVDVWTVKMTQGSIYKAVINEFELFDDTFFTVTEPLIVKTTNSLITRKVKLGSTKKIHVDTKVAIENDIDDAINNIFKDSVVSSPQFRILKKNEGSNLPDYVEVSGYSDTSALIDVTSNNDMLFTWDTNDIKTHAKVATGELGSITGPYILQVRYTILDEVIQTQDFYLLLT